MPPVITDKEYEIHYFDADNRRKAFVPRLINYFDDVVLYQSEQIGFDLDFFQKNRLAWVLCQWDISIERLPLYRDKIKVRTYPYAMKKFYGYRKYEIFDRQGEKIVTADSIWILIDMEKKRPSRISDGMCKTYGVDEGIEDLPDLDKLQPPVKIDDKKEFYVRQSDIDTNNHVNNVKYIEWAVELIPTEIICNYNLKNLKTSYKKETKYGEKINSQIEIENQNNMIKCFHKISDSSDNELCLIESKWVKGI